jgi:uncharacterized membrane protein
MCLLSALVLGFAAGLRSMSAPAAASWAARSGVFEVAGTPVAFMGYRYSPAIFSLLALGELVTDKLPTTPNRKTPAPFTGRILSGSLVGAAASSSTIVYGALVGAGGAVAGTLGGAAFRGELASRFSEDLPAALLEDAIAVGLCILAVKEASVKKV